MTDPIPTAEELEELLPGLSADTDNVVFEVESWQALTDLLRLLPKDVRVRIGEIVHPSNESRFSTARVARMIEVGTHCAVELIADGKLTDTLESDKPSCLIEGLVSMTNMLSWLFRHSEIEFEPYLAEAELYGYGIEPTVCEGDESND